MPTILKTHDIADVAGGVLANYLFTKRISSSYMATRMLEWTNISVKRRVSEKMSTSEATYLASLVSLWVIEEMRYVPLNDKGEFAFYFRQPLEDSSSSETSLEYLKSEGMKSPITLERFWTSLELGTRRATLSVIGVSEDVIAFADEVIRKTFEIASSNPIGGWSKK